MWATVATTCKYPFTTLLFYFTVVLSFALLSLIILFYHCLFFFLLFPFWLASHVFYVLFDTDMLPHTQLWPTVTKILKYDFLLRTHKLFLKSIPMAATPNKQFKNICVLSGFNYGKHKEFIEATIDLNRSIVERKLHSVYGGGNWGLSKLVSEATFVRENQVLGIIPRDIISDGGTNFCNKAFKALYDDFITYLNYAIKYYFIHSKAKKLFICTSNELLDLLQAYRPEPDPGTFVLESPKNDGNSSRSKKYKLDLTLRL